MRPIHLRALGMLAGFLAMGGVAAAVDTTDAPRVSVVFVEPARFTDVKDGALASPAGQQRILDALGRFVREVGTDAPLRYEKALLADWLRAELAK